VAGASKLGGIFSAVVGIPATFWRKIPACEDGGCPGSEALGVLVDGRSQLGENGLHPGAIVRSNCLSTEFPDAILETTSAQVHTRKNQLFDINYLL
jgi:hypothetical protein